MKETYVLLDEEHNIIMSRENSAKENIQLFQKNQEIFYHDFALGGVIEIRRWSIHDEQ